MFTNTRLIYTPSLKRFIRFREFRNDHLLALYKTHDSLTDSICTQLDILQDCIYDDIDINKLTILDSFFIFMTWRIDCVDDHINYTQDGEDVEIYLGDWLNNSMRILGEDYTKIINCEDLEIQLGLPTVLDDIEMQRSLMVGGNTQEQRVHQNLNLHTKCMFKFVNGLEIEKFDLKSNLFDNLTPSFYNLIINHSNDVTKKLSMVDLNLKIDGKNVPFTLDVIPVIIKFLFSGKSETIFEEGMYLTKKCNIGMSDYLKMSPTDSRHLIEYMMDNDQGDISDEMGNL